MVIIMSKKYKIKKTQVPFRNKFLMDGAIHTQVKGSKKGKRGYDRKDKSWKGDY
jgi:hypothetical protein